MGRNRRDEKEYDGVIYETTRKPGQRSEQAGASTHHLPQRRAARREPGEGESAYRGYQDQEAGPPNLTRSERNQARKPAARREQDGGYDYGYEDERYGEYGYEQERPRPAKRRRPEKSRPKPGRKPGQSRLMLLYAVTLFGGVVVCVIIFALLFNTFNSEGSRQRQASAATASPQPSPAAVPAQELARVTGIVRSIDYINRQVNIFDMSGGESVRLRADNSTQMRDRHYELLSFTEFEVGDIVDVGYDRDTSMMLELYRSTQSFTLSMKKDARVDTVNMTIAIGNDTFHYNDELLVIYDGNPYDIGMVTPADVITVSGVLNQAWIVVMNKSHGYLEINNIDYIKDGVVEIDTSVYHSIIKDEPIPLQEGPHNVVIRGSNIEPFALQIHVGHRQTVFIDIADAQIKSGFLNLIVSEDNYTLIINGEEISGSEPVMLDYGAHSMRIEKEGFETVEQEVDISQPVNDLMITMKKIVKMGNLTVITIPEDADVYIDNVLIGKSPTGAQVEMGSRTVTIKKEGYRVVSFPVDVDADHIHRTVELQPENQDALPPVATTLPAETEPPAATYAPAETLPAEPPDNTSATLPPNQPTMPPEQTEQPAEEQPAAELRSEEQPVAEQAAGPQETERPETETAPGQEPAENENISWYPFGD